MTVESKSARNSKGAAKPKAAARPRAKRAPADMAARKPAENAARKRGASQATDLGVQLAGTIFCELPYGLVLADEQGSVLSANPAAIEMGWQIDDSAPPTACREVFACRKQDGPCQHGCLVERAARSGEALPELRIDMAAGAPISAVWVTTVPLNEAAVLLHLRPGDARDRRRRSESHWIKDPELTIKALGRIRVDSREGPLGGNWLQQRPGQILKYLICERDRVVQAEEIAEALWPYSGRQALSSVRHFVHALRDRLEPGRARHTTTPFIITVRGGYAINRRHVRIDADVFAQSARDGLNAAQRGDDDTAAELLEFAISFYRGDLLEDEPYSEWAMAERDRLRGLATDSLRALVRLALARGDHATAVKHLERLAEFEPFDTDVHRELLRVLLTVGRRSEAVRRYQTFRARLGKEFNAEPGFTLADLQAY
jgi:DNA-binding SARP family transcriptional activator